MGRLWANMKNFFRNRGRNHTLESCLGDDTVLCKVAFEEKLQKLRVLYLMVLLLCVQEFMKYSRGNKRCVLAD